jgi:hypothetical protein
MTSVLKRYSQIDERVRYFVNFPDAEFPHYYTISSGNKTGVVDISDISGGVPQVDNDFMKDLGRTIYVHDAAVADESPVGPRVAILRQVQLVNGPGSEGVYGSAGNMFKSFWIATWVATDSTPYIRGNVSIKLAQVSRTG